MKLNYAILPLIAVLCSTVNAQVQAYRSYDVYDSVGVNTHWTAGSPYNYLNQFSTLVSMLQQATLHHISDGEWGNGANTTPWVTSKWSQLNAAGTKSDLITVSNNESQTLAPLEADLKLYPGLEAIEAIEAMNEWDHGGGPGWVATMQVKLPILRQAGVDLGIPMIGPSPVESSSFAQLGDISRYLTWGNIHNYQGFPNPETQGWGGGVSAEGRRYGSILWNVEMRMNMPRACQLSQQRSGTRQVWQPSRCPKRWRALMRHASIWRVFCAVSRELTCTNYWMTPTGSRTGVCCISI